MKYASLFFALGQQRDRSYSLPSTTFPSISSITTTPIILNPPNQIPKQTIFFYSQTKLPTFPYNP